jgi:hypothetical protein
MWLCVVLWCGWSLVLALCPVGLFAPSPLHCVRHVLHNVQTDGDGRVRVRVRVRVTSRACTALAVPVPSSGDPLKGTSRALREAMQHAALH